MTKSAENIEILASIPNSMEIARRYSKGDFVDYFVQHFDYALENIVNKSCILNTNKML